MTYAFQSVKCYLSTIMMITKLELALVVNPKRK